MREREIKLLLLTLSAQSFFLFASIWLAYTDRHRLDTISTCCSLGLGLVGYAIALYQMPWLSRLPNGWRLSIVSVVAIGLDVTVPVLVGFLLFASGCLATPGLAG